MMQDDGSAGTVRDEGEGFDWHSYLELDPVRVTDNHGRGIVITGFWGVQL